MLVTRLSAGLCPWRSALCGVLVAALTLSAVAEDAPGAMLYAKGTTEVNGNVVPDSLAIFPHDLIETQVDSYGNINATGSNVIVAPESIVKFLKNAVCVEHGIVDIGSSTQMAALAGGFRITPVSPVWSQFNVKDVEGTVEIDARKGDLEVTGGKKKITVPQGQHASLEESRSRNNDSKNNNNDDCGRKPFAAPPAGSGGVLGTKAAIIAGAAGGGGILIWILPQGDKPVSPDQRTCARKKSC